MIVLFINNETSLIKEKSVFFNTYLDFINHHMPNEIKEYVSAFLSNNMTSPFHINKDLDLSPPSTSASNQQLFYCILYICARGIDVYWEDFFQYIHSLSPALPLDFSSSFLFTNTSIPQSSLYTIRQCRVDKPLYTLSATINVGFYNKNENFTYHCYDDQQTRSYVANQCGQKALAAYNHIQYPQAKSDFFLMASLYKDGGISADVCAVAQTNLEILIKDTELLLIYDDKGIHKKFVFAHPNNPFIEYHFNYLINQMDHFGADADYEHFSSRSIFHHNFMDFYAFHFEEIKNIRLNFLHDDIYTAFVHDEIIEERLSEPNDFPSIVAKGAFRKQQVPIPATITPAITTSTQNFYMPATSNLTIIGKDNNPHFANRVNTAYTLPSLNVWAVENVDLAGLGWGWKYNQFISFESHLSDLAFDHNYQKIWEKPNHNNITKMINDECIIAFSAGSNCYGHYLVDDLPRIGLIKDYLGDAFYQKKFIISHETPEWGKNLLKFFFNLNDDHFIVFDFSKEIWKLRKVFLSSFPNKEYNFHSYIREFYKKYYPSDIQPFRKICISRKTWRTDEKDFQRVFQSREVFEYLAESYGFDVICPEDLFIEEQIQLMAETVCQVGEHGSGQHASVFNPNGMIVGTINPLTNVQMTLGRVYNDINIACYADHSYMTEGHNIYYDIEHEKLIGFFDQIKEYL